jgi:hypothetical protein
MPRTGQAPEDLLSGAVPLAGTAGAAYVERRGVPVAVADGAGVRFAPDFGGRPAVLAPLRGEDGRLAAVHGRYLHATRRQDKMLTIAVGGGLIAVGSGWGAEPLVLVEGLFDALSLATCGRSCAATIGRWAPWLPRIARGRRVWLGFDATRSGEADAAWYEARLGAEGARARRLPPPPRCKDWSTALVKRGRHAVATWVACCLDAPGG